MCWDEISRFSYYIEGTVIYRKVYSGMPKWVLKYAVVMLLLSEGIYCKELESKLITNHKVSPPTDRKKGI